MVVAVSSAHFMNLVTPNPTDMPSAPYGIAVPWKDLVHPLDEIMAEQIMWAKGTKWGLVNLRSSRSPQICGMEPNNTDLIRFRQELDAVNLSIESILVDQPVEIYIEFWEKTRTAVAEIGVSFSAIRIDPSKIEIPNPFSEEWIAMKGAS